MLSSHVFKRVPKIKFIEQRFIAFIVTAILVFGSIALISVRGLNLGIDFVGGVLIEAKVQPNVTVSEVRSLLHHAHVGDFSLQTFGAKDVYLIRVGTPKGSQKLHGEQVIVKKVKGTLGNRVVNYRRVEVVGPVVGSELMKKAILALSLGLLSIFIYVWFRFDWQYALCGVFALLHDVIATIGVFSLTSLEFNLTSVAALLTIAGYSINDTVVIYDRVRENRRKYKKMSLVELFNLSINETLSRTLMTSFATLLAVLGLLIFGGDVIKGFSVAMFFGIIVGTYSSIAVALGMLLYLNPKDKPSDLEDDTVDA